MKHFPLPDPVCQCDSGVCQTKVPGWFDEVCNAYGDDSAQYKCGSCHCDVNTGDRETYPGFALYNRFFPCIEDTSKRTILCMEATLMP